MKRQTVFGIAASLAFAALALGGIVHAQSPREQLQQMVEQLQKTPNDNALRERIIKLGAEIKPAPVMPDEAIHFEGRAQAAFKNAGSRTGFMSAVKEYEQAVVIAPWAVGYYFDLCTIYEKAGIYLEAQRNCQLALVGEQGASERVDLKRRIAGLGLLAEKTSDQTLRSNYLMPFPMETGSAKWPGGSRYFCEAWSRDNETNSRQEYWVVYDGSALVGVNITWFSSEFLAKTFRKFGGDSYEIMTFRPYRRDPSSERKFDEEDNPGIQTGWKLEISSDKTTIYRSDMDGAQKSCKRQDK